MDLSWLDDFLWTYQNVIHSLGINGLLALSMYVVLAVGQLSLGQAAFMGLGAYSAALMTLKLGWPFWMVLPLSCVVPILFALAIGLPTLRLSGVYLAIATVGLGEVLKALYVNIDYVGGALGLTGIPEETETWMIYTLLALAVLAFFGNALPLLVALMGLYGWERYARIARGLAIAANAQGYAAAVRQIGARPLRIYLGHVLPNIASTLIVSATLSFPEIVLLESGLSFLGLGVQPPMTSLGNMVGFGREYITRAPWILLAPSVTIVLTTLCVSLLGDWLRDRLDPTLT